MGAATRPNLDLMALIKKNYDLQKLAEMRAINNNPKIAICSIDQVKECDDSENHNTSSQSSFCGELKKISSAQKSKK